MPPHLLISLFSLRCNPCFPLAYKRESRASHEGDSNPSNPKPIKTHKHPAEKRRALGTRSLLSPVTWDLSLSQLFITPTMNF